VKIRLEGAELFHAVGWADTRDDINSSFSQFCENRLQNMAPAYFSPSQMYHWYTLCRRLQNRILVHYQWRD